MPFKINISNKGKTTQLETESEVIVGKAIGEKIKGNDISADLEGYELEITGTSDISGFPGKKGLEGTGYHRQLLTKGFAMKNTQKGLRLRKTLRGQEVSLKTAQINTKVIKQGIKKFEDLAGKKEPAEEAKPVEEKKEEPKEEKKEEVKTEEPKAEPSGIPSEKPKEKPAEPKAE
jgi:small subunit ribosomal protein S6e